MIILRTAIRHISLFGLIAVMLCTALPAVGQEGSVKDPKPPKSPKTFDTEISDLTPVPFVEIHLSPEGVFGVDSSGTEWDFDFSSEQFVTGGRTTGTSRIFRPEDLEEFEASTEEFNRVLEEYENAGLDRDSLERLIPKLVKYRGLQIGRVTINEGEIVEGSISAYGIVLVKGVVNGDVTSYKRIVVTSTGVINGDARAPEIIRERGGVIHGTIIETDVPELPDIQFFERTSYTSLTVFSIILISLLLCMMLALAVAPKQINNVQECIRTGFVRSFLIGLALWFGLGPLIVLLSLTVIGIPVAVFVLPIALVLGLLVGIIAFSQFMGDNLKNRVRWVGSSQFRKSLVGFVAIYMPWMLMAIFAIYNGGFSSFLYTLMLVASIMLWSFVVCTGLGAVILTRFGFRNCRKERPGKYRVSVEVGKVTPPPPPSPPPDISSNPAPPSPPPLQDDQKGKDGNPDEDQK